MNLSHLVQKNIADVASINTIDSIKTFGSRLTGLTNYEANIRLKTLGKNKLKKEKGLLMILEFASILKNPLVLLLLCVSIVSFFLGETINATIILIMLGLSVTLNFFQEYKATRSAQKLREKVALHTTILRNGKTSDVKTEDVTVGDIIILNAGDLIPADGRLIEAKDFFVNESNLTGESFPVEKTPDTIHIEKPDLTDLTNIVFAGTNVVTGSAKMLVVKTGSHTQFGAIADTLGTKGGENEFSKGTTRFSTMILRIIIVFVCTIFLINALLKHDILEAFAFSVAVAVGLTPEFLPMIMTVTMGKGSLIMAKRGVIVKKLAAIPAFGSMDILATDKTGTLTEAKIRLVKYVDIAGVHSENVLTNAYLNSLHQSGISNPMDDAVLEYKTLDVSMYKKIDEIPFDFARKKMSVVVEKQHVQTIITKGAPEEIFTSCTSCHYKGELHPFDKQTRALSTDLYHNLSREGYRVLAVAVKTIRSKKRVYTKSDETDLELIGFTAFLDPARIGTKEAIDKLEEMGIEIKIITGDNELVSKKICNDVGVSIKGILLGHEIDSLSDEALAQRAIRVTLFARFSPQQKARVIAALRKSGHVVGYLGDGINDASSLTSADVGISVSNAVDVAKESADIILTHKSLHELKDGVIEGRKIFGNTMKYIMMGLSSNFGNMFSVLGAVLFLPFLPMLPIQILLNNFLYDISQLTIPSDNVDKEYIQKPKRWDMKFIRLFMFVFGPISSVFDFTTYALLYIIYKSSPASFQTGWFMESLATQTLVIHVIRTRFTPVIQSSASIWLWITTVASVIIGWIIPYTPIGIYFGFHPLEIQVVIMLIFIVVIYLLTTEIGKRHFYKRYYV